MAVYKQPLYFTPFVAQKQLHNIAYCIKSGRSLPKQYPSLEPAIQRLHAPSVLIFLLGPGLADEDAFLLPFRHESAWFQDYSYAGTYLPLLVVFLQFDSGLSNFKPGTVLDAYSAAQ